jgi:spoIIIJ-associated protein
MDTSKSIDSAIEPVRSLVERVVTAIDIDAEVNVTTQEGSIYANVSVAEEEDNVGRLIGRHGQTIDAVQHLAYKVASKQVSPAPKVVIDADGYRERRNAILERTAYKAAADAIRTQQPVALDVMGPIDRKTVHEFLKDNVEVETYSEGTDPHRHLVITPAGDE